MEVNIRCGHMTHKSSLLIVLNKASLINPSPAEPRCAKMCPDTANSVDPDQLASEAN